MGTISRVKDFVDGEILTADDLDSEFNRIHNLVNGNLDTANLLDDGVDLSQVAQAGSLDVTSVFADNVITASKINDIPDNSVSTSQANFADDDDLEFGAEPDFAVRYDQANDRFELVDLVNSVDILRALKNGKIVIGADLEAIDGETIWDESNTHIPRGRIQPLSQSEIDSSAVGRNELKTATGSANISITDNDLGSITLNAYSFAHDREAGNNEGANWQYRTANGSSPSADNPVRRWENQTGVGTENRTLYFAWRYAQSSPPYKLGDGVAGLFIYVQVDNNGGIIKSWASQDPPWSNRHTTNVQGKGLCYIDKNGHSSMLEAQRNGGVEYTPVEEDKNRYMNRYPHPFGEDEHVLLLDPVGDVSRDLFDINDPMNLDPDEPNVSKLFTEGYIELTEDLTEKRCGPEGIDIYGCRWS